MTADWRLSAAGTAHGQAGNLQAWLPDADRNTLSAFATTLAGGEGAPTNPSALAKLPLPTLAASFLTFVGSGLRDDVGSCSGLRRVVTEDTVVAFVADALFVESAEAVVMVLALVASVTLPF